MMKKYLIPLITIILFPIGAEAFPFGKKIYDISCEYLIKDEKESNKERFIIDPKIDNGTYIQYKSNGEVDTQDMVTYEESPNQLKIKYIYPDYTRIGWFYTFDKNDFTKFKVIEVEKEFGEYGDYVEVDSATQYEFYKCKKTK